MLVDDRELKVQFCLETKFKKFQVISKLKLPFLEVSRNQAILLPDYFFYHQLISHIQMQKINPWHKVCCGDFDLLISLLQLVGF